MQPTILRHRGDSVLLPPWAAAYGRIAAMYASPSFLRAILVLACTVLFGAGCSPDVPRDINRPAKASDGSDLMPNGSTIAGRIEDPHGLVPEDAVLTVGSMESDGSFGSRQVEVAPDGRFRTPALPPGTHVLQLVQPPGSPSGRHKLLGLATVPVSDADVVGAEITAQRDIAVTGRFRMESDNTNAEWPPHLVVIAPLIVGGMGPSLDVAQGAPGGRFVLQNALGPRVIRTGYSLSPGNSWWPSRVLLDGKDVTDVPTDFSRHPGSKLEVVFTQHPARITGIVLDASGQAVARAWVLVCAADSVPCEGWAMTSRSVQADVDGAFRIAVVAGRYVLRAFAPDVFTSRRDAERGLAAIAADPTAVDVADRATQRVLLVVK